MALPPGAKWVYKALGLDVPAAGQEEASPFPPSAFADELALAAVLLRAPYPRRLYPCLYNTAGIIAPTRADDQILYDAALGYYTAFLIVGGSSAAPGVGGPVMVKRKLLDIEYTFKNVDAADRGNGWEALAFQYMDAVSCVGGDLSGAAGIVAGLIQNANPNTDEAGRLTDNRGVPLEAGYPYSTWAGGRRENLP